VGGVDITEEKHGRKVFRLVHSGESGASDDLRSHNFEADSGTVDDFVKTVTLYLDQRKSQLRDSYLNRNAKTKASLFKRFNSQRERARPPPKSKHDWE